MLSLESQFKQLNLDRIFLDGTDSAGSMEHFKKVRSLVRIVATHSGG